MYAHAVCTWIYKLGPTLLLITCHDLDVPLQSTRYWGSRQLDLDAQALVDILAIGWQIETFFEYEKDLLDSDHYQLISAQAILRFWALVASLMCFLEEQHSSDRVQSLTYGDVRRSIRYPHRLNLLHWHAQSFLAGATVEQVGNQSALFGS